MKIGLFLIPGIILFFQISSFAQIQEPTQTDQRILSHTFNEEFDLARTLCDEQIKLNPASPKYYYYMMNMKVIEYYQKVRELKPENRSEGRKALNKEMIDYGENVLDKFDPDKLSNENKFYYAMITGYLARVYGVDGSWWSAFRKGKSTRSMMREIVEKESGFYDAYLAIGMLNYYADRLSGITGFIAGILGFSGDRTGGLRDLNLAFKNGKITFGQAALTLIEVYSSLEGNDYAAIPYYEAYIKQYPKSKRVMSNYINLLAGLRDIKRIEKIIKEDKYGVVDDLSKAQFYDLSGNSSEAVKLAEKYLSAEKNNTRGINNARYLVVYNSWLLGDRGKASKYESELSQGQKENINLFKSNETGAKWLRELSVKINLSKPLSEIESFFNQRPDLKKGADIENQFKQLAGFFYFRERRYDNAENYFFSILDNGNEREKIYASRFLLEIFLSQQRDKKKAEKLYDIIDDLDSDQLKYRAKDLEKKYDL